MQCRVCLSDKPPEDFDIARENATGRKTVCKACRSLVVRTRVNFKVDRIAGTKGCSRCRKIKPLSEYHKMARGAYTGRCKACTSELSRAKRSTPEGRLAERLSQIRKKFRVTNPEAKRLLAIDTCQICGRGVRGFGERHVDHSHITGQVRGVLCQGCNHGLGKFRDSPEILRKAADYLEATTSVQPEPEV